MEKLLRRTILNRNQLVTKRRREQAKEVTKKWREFNRYTGLRTTELANMIKNERVARREDWMLGPLAPKRDVGPAKATYGSVDNILGQAPALPLTERRGPRGRGHDARGSENKRIPGFEDGEWKGEGLVGNVVVGDRVAIIRGRPGVKGKVGRVIRVEHESNMVFVKDINKVDMVVPPAAVVSSSGAKIFEQELPIPISDVLLVNRIKDPNTGVEKDVVVRHVRGGAPYIQREAGSNQPRHTRYIVNYAHNDGSVSDVAIGWPKEDPERFYTQSCDTPRDKVEERTYYPAFSGEVPLEPGAIDELRGKHARSRTDWDDQEFLQKKLIEDARRDWFAERSRILSQPFWTKEFLLKEKKMVEERTRKIQSEL